MHLQFVEEYPGEARERAREIDAALGVLAKGSGHAPTARPWQNRVVAERHDYLSSLARARMARLDAAIGQFLEEVANARTTAP